MQRGVSLIELIIGMAIVAILLAVAMPSFTSSIQNSQIRKTAEAIQNGLSLARAEGVLRNTHVQFSLVAGNSWTVQCETAIGGTPPLCPGTSPAATTPSSIQNWNAGGSNAAVTPATATLSFNGMGKVTAATLAPGTTLTFVISSTTGACTAPTRCLNVVVTSGGQVRMCDPALASSDPQAC